TRARTRDRADRLPRSGTQLRPLHSAHNRRPNSPRLLVWTVPRPATSRIGTIGQRPVKPAPAPLRVLLGVKAPSAATYRQPTAGLSILRLALTDGAVMEPWGRNRWQIAHPRKRWKQAKTVAVGCDQLPRDGQGVSGSSPEEGFRFCLLSESLRSLRRQRRVRSTSTRRPPRGGRRP